MGDGGQRYRGNGKNKQGKRIGLHRGLITQASCGCRFGYEHRFQNDERASPQIINDDGVDLISASNLAGLTNRIFGSTILWQFRLGIRT
mmetsp:Transcript_20164/g.57846  ORF Transcript_20164/g.57846 Transcript_20164/m.57846 type:complete len:89 (-) Transcript_20164:127-393(-)